MTISTVIDVNDLIQYAEFIERWRRLMVNIFIPAMSPLLSHDDATDTQCWYEVAEKWKLNYWTKVSMAKWQIMILNFNFNVRNVHAVDRELEGIHMCSHYRKLEIPKFWSKVLRIWFIMKSEISRISIPHNQIVCGWRGRVLHKSHYSWLDMNGEHLKFHLQDQNSAKIHLQWVNSIN